MVLSEKIFFKFSAFQGCLPAQIASVWLLAQKPFIVPHPGTSKLNRLQEDIGGASVSLSDELSKINTALAAIKIVGERYPASIHNIVGK